MYLSAQIVMQALRMFSLTAHALARVVQRQQVVHTKQACPRMQQSRSGLYVSVMQSHALCGSENGEVPCIQQHVCCCGCCQKIPLARQTPILGCCQPLVWWCNSLIRVSPTVVSASNSVSYNRPTAANQPKKGNISCMSCNGTQGSASLRKDTLSPPPPRAPPPHTHKLVSETPLISPPCFRTQNALHACACSSQQGSPIGSLRHTTPWQALHCHV